MASFLSGERVAQVYKQLEETVYKCAVTIFAGIGTFALGEGIVRIPFLTTYLPLQPFTVISNKIWVLTTTIEVITCLILGKNYTDQLHACIVGPIAEEFGHRFIFQELTLKGGMKFCAKQLGIPFDPNHIVSKVIRIALSSLVFAAFHTWAFSTNLAINPYGAAALVYITAIGIILGSAQEMTGNTLYPIAIHIINNTMTWYLTNSLLIQQ